MINDPDPANETTDGYQSSALRKAIFLDRDGVININRSDYVKSWDEFVFLPTSKQALKIINGSDFLLIIVTNQSPIGRGIFTTETLDGIHKRMLHELAEAGGYIDAIYYCPHKPDDGCSCRKPKPGLILRAAEDFDVDVAKSWMVGDSDSDMEAGKLAGCKTAKVSEDRPLIEIVKDILMNE